MRNYPVWNLTRTNSTLCCGREVCFDSLFAGFPIKRERVGGWGGARNLEKGGRWVRVTEHADYLLKVEGTRTFPWRTFILVDKPSDLCQADIVYALASPAAAGSDFSWVKPGKVAWDWWNCFDNQGSKVASRSITKATSTPLLIDLLPTLLTKPNSQKLHLSIA